jgi:hypothetical protein
MWLNFQAVAATPNKATTTATVPNFVLTEFEDSDSEINPKLATPERVVKQKEKEKQLARHAKFWQQTIDVVTVHQQAHATALVASSSIVQDPAVKSLLVSIAYSSLFMAKSTAKSAQVAEEKKLLKLAWGKMGTKLKSYLSGGWQLNKTLNQQMSSIRASNSWKRIQNMQLTTWCKI